MSRTEYVDLLETVARYAAQLRGVRPSAGLDTAPGIIKTMQFNGMFNVAFREETAPQVGALLNEMTLELTRAAAV
jgi:hypothetical protein